MTALFSWIWSGVSGRKRRNSCAGRLHGDGCAEMAARRRLSWTRGNCTYRRYWRILLNLVRRCASSSLWERWNVGSCYMIGLRGGVPEHRSGVHSVLFAQAVELLPAVAVAVAVHGSTMQARHGRSKVRLLGRPEFEAFYQRTYLAQCIRILFETI